MKKIYFVRHAESLANAEQTNHSDPVLSEQGRKQAKYLAERFKKIPVDLIISSHLARAKETARYISVVTKKATVEEPLFSERKPPSEIEGKSYLAKEVSSVFNDMYKHYFKGKGRYSDEENFDDLKRRGSAALRYLEQRSERNIVVVTHGIFLRVLVGSIVFGKALSGRELFQFLHHLYTKNTGITLCEYWEGKENRHLETEKVIHWRVIAWNDHAHLG